MEYKPRTGSKSLFLHLLLLLLLLASSSLSTTAQTEDVDCAPGGDPEADLDNISWESDEEASVENGTLGNKEGDQQPSEGNYKQCPAEFQCQCPAVCECPEPKYFNQIKDDLAPFIRQQFRELLKKALDN